MSVRNILAIAAILVCTLCIPAIPAVSQANSEVNDPSPSAAHATGSDDNTTAYDRQWLAEAPQYSSPAPPAANQQDVQSPAGVGNPNPNPNADGKALPLQAAGTSQSVETSQSWLEYGLLVLLLAMVLLLAANLMIERGPPKQY